MNDYSPGVSKKRKFRKDWCVQIACFLSTSKSAKGPQTRNIKNLSGGVVNPVTAKLGRPTSLNICWGKKWRGFRKQFRKKSKEKLAGFFDPSGGYGSLDRGKLVILGCRVKYVPKLLEISIFFSFSGDVCS